MGGSKIIEGLEGPENWGGSGSLEDARSKKGVRDMGGRSKRYEKLTFLGGPHLDFDPIGYTLSWCGSLYHGLWLLKFIYSEKATKFCEIFPLLLTVCSQK